ncbi:hypothetical protein C8F04DRAFT_1173926 [Mycena alexandri]|uniref:Uncharacterized protein n=1 Tax=Mycena alexandri TaxID=1745969 RepID=A0AAD6TGH7_9AGAR|nr:hypothetical protein C8F04DRAFT_1173926 [Mycena alexandri]
MPSLPPELEREIVEIARLATFISGQIVANLKDPISPTDDGNQGRPFYESMVTTGYRNADKFLDLVDLKPADFFASGAVKSLYIHPATDSHMARVLAACAGVQALVPELAKLRSAIESEFHTGELN